jgi:hypothetical protein
MHNDENNLTTILFFRILHISQVTWAIGMCR